MKPTSRYATLRAVGQGTVMGCIGGGSLGLVYAYLGETGFYGLCLLVGVSSWGMAELLDRRARRQRQRDAERPS